MSAPHFFELGSAYPKSALLRAAEESGTTQHIRLCNGDLIENGICTTYHQLRVSDEVSTLEKGDGIKNAFLSALEKITTPSV